MKRMICILFLCLPVTIAQAKPWVHPYSFKQTSSETVQAKILHALDILEEIERLSESTECHVPSRLLWRDFQQLSHQIYRLSRYYRLPFSKQVFIANMAQLEQRLLQRLRYLRC